MLPGINWPLDRNIIRKQILNNTFGADVRRYSDGRPKPHQGWDFEAKVGTPTYAIADGTVVFVVNHGDYGLQVCMSFSVQQHTYYAFYAHLLKSFVHRGEQVKMNQVIGHTGKSGNASNLAADEDHLHFEIRTQVHCGLGITGRVSPLKIFLVCPLRTAVLAKHPKKTPG